MLLSDYAGKVRRLTTQQTPTRWASTGKVPQQPINNFKKTIEEFTFLSTDQIGSGLTSKVFRGKDDRSGEVVCVKMIDMKRQECPRFQQLLRSEIQLLRQLKHPNIIDLKQVYHTFNNCYIITEFCPRGDVAAYLKTRLRLPQEQALVLLKDLLAAFNHLVRKGIIHRDIKPANTFLMTDGTLKLADFGFAMASNDNELSRMNVGSPVYMAPQCLKKSQYSHKSDIFSIGIFYYELLYGYTPWPCRSEDELLRRLQSQPLRFSQNCSVSDLSKDFITRCLQINKQYRINEYDIFNHQLLMGSGRGSTGTVATSNLDTTKDSQPTIDQYQLTKAQGKIKNKKSKKAQAKPTASQIFQRIRALQSSNNSHQSSRKQISFEPIDRKISIQQSLQCLRQTSRKQSQQMPQQKQRNNHVDEAYGSLTLTPATERSRGQSILKRMGGQHDRNRFKSQISAESIQRPVSRQQKIYPSIISSKKSWFISPQNKVRLINLFEKSAMCLKDTMTESASVSILLSKILYIISRLDKLINGNRSWHTHLTETEDPYLRSTQAQKDIVQVCKVAQFYFRRTTRFLNQQLMEEGSQSRSLTTLLVLLSRVQAVMDCFINGQQVIIQDISRVNFFRSDYKSN